MRTCHHDDCCAAAEASICSSGGEAVVETDLYIISPGSLKLMYTRLKMPLSSIYRSFFRVKSALQSLTVTTYTRLAMLYHHGGYYTDFSMLWTAPLPTHM